MEQSAKEFIVYSHLHKYTGTNPDVVIPDGVQVVMHTAFQGNETIRSIRLPASTKFASSYAFARCKNLNTADLSLCEDLMTWGNNLFENCSALTTVSLPPQVQERYKVEISSNSFAHCYLLQTIKLPEGVCAIGENVFGCCFSLTHVELPNSITAIGSRAFGRCWSLEKLVLPENIKSIPFGLVWDCVNLAEFSIPEGVESIGGCAFENCTQLSEIKIPGAVVSIGSKAFMGCENLSRVYIPDSVQEIGNQAFFNCADNFVLQSSNPKWKKYARKERLKFELIENPFVK